MPKRKPNLVILTVLVAFTIVCLSLGRDLFGFSGNILDGLFSPIRKVVWAAGRNFSARDPELDQLRHEIALLQSQVADYGKVAEENESLKKQLEISETSERTLIMADVIGRGTGVLRTNQGGRSGVNIGMAVISGKSVIGKVTSVSQWGSNVALLTSSDSSDFKMAVLVRGSVSGTRRAQGLAVGRGGKLILSRVLRMEKIAEGDLVVTMGGEGEPAGLVLGKVISVDETGSVYTEAVVEPPLEFGLLDFVYIVK
jgi:rod shape-determining protein MreC